MNTITEFCKRHGLTENQFHGIDPIGGYLYLRSLTSIPKEFNPTVGGDLYTNGHKCNHTKLENKILSWQDGKYIKVDGIFTEVVSKKGGIWTVKRVNKSDVSYLVTDNKGKFAHGETLQKAKDDLRFKVLSEKIKKEPITENTIIDNNYYRIVTGACEMGVKQWREQNNITVETITAKELLPLLQKTNAYGYERFKQLINF